MSRLHALVLSLTVLSSLARAVNFSKHLSHAGKDLVTSRKVTADAVTLSYALCDRQSTASARSCVLSLESISATGTKRLRSCATQLDRARPDEPEYRKYKLVQVGEDELLLVWKQAQGMKKRRRRSYMLPIFYFRELLKARVVRMTDCEVREAALTVENRNERPEQGIGGFNVLEYGNGSFAMFLRNRKFCRPKERCSVSYDAATRRFYDSKDLTLPVPYHATAEMFAITSPNSTVEAYVVPATFLDDGSVKLISPRGQLLYEHLYSLSMLNIPLRASHVAISREASRLGLCQQGMFQASLDCSVFDREGKAQMGVSVALKTADVSALRMRNAPDGGFWLLVGYAADKEAASFEALDVLRVNADGTMGQVQERGSVSCPLAKSELELGFFEKNGTEYCYYMACTWPNDGQEDEFNLQFYSWCYPEERERDE